MLKDEILKRLRDVNKNPDVKGWKVLDEVKQMVLQNDAVYSKDRLSLSALFEIRESMKYTKRILVATRREALKKKADEVRSAIEFASRLVDTPSLKDMEALLVSYRKESGRVCKEAWHYVKEAVNYVKTRLREKQFAELVHATARASSKDKVRQCFAFALKCKDSGLLTNDDMDALLQERNTALSRLGSDLQNRAVMSVGRILEAV